MQNISFVVTTDTEPTAQPAPGTITIRDNLTRDELRLYLLMPDSKLVRFLDALVQAADYLRGDAEARLIHNDGHDHDPALGFWRTCTTCEALHDAQRDREAATR